LALPEEGLRREIVRNLPHLIVFIRDKVPWSDRTRSGPLGGLRRDRILPVSKILVELLRLLQVLNLRSTRS